MSSLEQQIKELAAKAEAWDALVASYTVPVAPGFGYRPWDEAIILERDQWIRRTHAVEAKAEPIHTSSCTMTSIGTDEARCIGYHCPRCGMPTSCQGHTSRRACSEALSAYNERLYGTPAEAKAPEVNAEARRFWNDRFPKRP